MKALVITDAIKATEAWADHASQVRNLAMALQVTSAEEYQLADASIEKITTRKKDWQLKYEKARETLEPAVKTLSVAAKAIKTLDEAIKIVKGGMHKYREDDRLRIEEEERKIRKAAELEKKEKEDVARINREAAESARRRLEAAAKKEKDSERQAVAEEQVLEAQEKVAAAEREEEAAKQLALPAVEVKSEVPQVENTTTRTEWKARVVDMEKLPRHFLICEPNMMRLNEYARTEKGKARVPGVEFYEHETVVRVGTRGKM